MNLQRQLWRYECGLVSRVSLEAQLTHEVNRLVTLFRQEESRWWRVAQPGRKEFALRAFFGQQIDAAREEILRGNLRSGWQNLQEAERNLRKLLAAVEAEEHITAAETLLQSLPTDIADARMGVAMITAAAERLVMRAKEERDRSDFNAAAQMARLAREQIEGGPSTDLAERLGSIRKADVGLLARFPSAPVHMTFVEALTIAERLMAQQQRGLATRLCDDLEEESRARASFLHELESQSKAMPEGDPHSLEAALVQLGRISGESWQSALHRLLHSQLQRVAERIRTIDAARIAAEGPTEVTAHESP